MPDCGVRDTTPHAVVFTMTATAIYSHQHGLRTLTYKNTYTTAYTCSIFNQIKLVKCGTDGRLLLSGFQSLVTFTLDRVMRYTDVHQSLTSIYLSNFFEIGKTFLDGLTAGIPQSSRSRDRKSRTNIKNPAQ